MADDKPFKGMLIGLPCYGGELKMEAHSSISHLRYMLGRLNVPSTEYTLSMCDIVETRNCMLTFWYDECVEFDYLLMVDNDMQFAPSLIFQMLKLDQPVTGVIYSKRMVPKGGDMRSLIIGEALPGENPIVDGFQQWKYVGGGVVLIKREVVTKMLKMLPEINDCVDPGSLANTGVTRIIKAFDRIKMPEGHSLSEDYSFCERWRQCGGEIWAAVDQPIGHIGNFNYCIQASELLGLHKKPPVQAAA